MRVGRTEPEFVPVALLTDQEQSVDDVVDVGEDALLRSGRCHRELLAGEQLLPEDLDQRAVRPRPLAGPEDVVEVGDREREAVPLAVVANELGVRRLREGIGALIASEAAVGELRRRSGVDELRSFRPPVLEDVERPENVEIPDDIRLGEARLDAGVLTEVVDEVGPLGNRRGNVARVGVAIVDAGNVVTASTDEVVVERDDAVRRARRGGRRGASR